MAAYVIANIKVTDPAGYEGYKKLAGPAIEACGAVTGYAAAGPMYGR